MNVQFEIDLATKSKHAYIKEQRQLRKLKRGK